MILESKYWIALFLFGFLFLAGCFPASPELGEVTPTAGLQPSPTQELHLLPEAAAKEPTVISATSTSESKPDPTKTPEIRSETQSQAMILSVKVSGEAGGYNFTVTVSSPDEGCSQYADWWRWSTRMKNWFTAGSCCTVMSMSSHSPVLEGQYPLKLTKK